MPCRVDLCPTCQKYECGGFSGGTCQYAIISDTPVKPVPVSEKPTGIIRRILSGREDESCPTCHKQECGGYMEGVLCDTRKAHDAFDTSGALCDVLTMLEELHPHAYGRVDKATLEWWESHQQNEQDKIKKEALSKLSPEERRALNLE